MRLPLALALLCMLPGGVALAQKAVSPTPLPAPTTKVAPTTSTPAAHEWAAVNLKDWPVDRQGAGGTSGDALRRAPGNHALFDRLVQQRAVGKRTILYKDGDQHRFPLPHQDVLWQTVNYKVPLNKVVALMTYDGSILIDRTRGEITAHCDSEEANTLILNIANTIVTGENTVEQAMAYHAQVVEGMRIHEPEDYPLKLRFQTPKTNAATADPAEEAELLRHPMNTPPAPAGPRRVIGACRENSARLRGRRALRPAHAPAPGTARHCGSRRWPAAAPGRCPTRWPVRPDVPAATRTPVPRSPSRASLPCCSR